MDASRGPAPPTFKSTAAYLEHLSIIIMEDHLSSDYAILREHLSDDFEQIDASLHNCAFPQSSNLEHHLRNIDIFKKAHPNWKLVVWNVTVQLLKGSNSAEVWITLRGCGDAKTTMLNRESVSVLHWRRRHDNGKWVCYRHSALRGSGDFLE